MLGHHGQLRAMRLLHLLLHSFTTSCARASRGPSCDHGRLGYWGPLRQSYADLRSLMISSAARLPEDNVQGTERRESKEVEGEPLRLVMRVVVSIVILGLAVAGILAKTSTEAA
jgi:hypothetical protein